MQGFIKSLGSLSCGGRRKKPTIIRDTDEPSSVEQYENATTDEQRKAIFEKERAAIEREKMVDRMRIV